MSGPLRWVAAIAVVLAPLSVCHAAIVSYTISPTNEFGGSGATFNGSILATFDDGGGTGSVTLTIDLTGVTGPTGLKFNDFYFNTDPFVTLTATYVSGPPIDSFASTEDAHKADGDGDFDNHLIYLTGASDDTFTLGETSVITLTGTGITANSFDALSVGGDKGSFHVAVHILSLGPDGQLSGFFADLPPIPEPTSIVAWLLGAGGLGLILRRRMTKRPT